MEVNVDGLKKVLEIYKDCRSVAYVLDSEENESDDPIYKVMLMKR